MKSNSILRLFVAILICTSCYSSLFSQVSPNAGFYWYEGFQESTFQQASSDPSLAVGSVVVTYQKGAAVDGTWAVYGEYVSTGSGCTVAPYGAKNMRSVKYTDGTTPWVVTPVVSAGISEVHFTATTASKRWFIQWTSDTAATTTNWNKILDSASVKTSCVDSVLIINQPTAKRIRFKAPAVAAGYQLDLDSVYLKSYGALPVSFASINARLSTNIVKVNWVSANEINVASYTIESSVDGNTFSTVGTVLASNKSNYSFTDASPVNGVNYYRIKSVDADGSYQYSSVVKVSTLASAVKVYPNPVVGRKLFIEGLDAGKYTVNIYNVVGQRVSSSYINVNGASQLALPNSIKSGTYQLELSNGVSRVVKAIAVQ